MDMTMSELLASLLSTTHRAISGGVGRCTDGGELCEGGPAERREGDQHLLRPKVLMPRRSVRIPIRAVGPNAARKSLIFLS